MVSTVSVFSNLYFAQLTIKSISQTRCIFFYYGLLNIIGAAAVMYLLIYLLQPFTAHAETNSSIQTEAANSFVFGRVNQNDIPLALKLSPYTPAPNEYKRFEEMSKDDRRLALGQIAVGLLAQSLDNRIGRAMLAVTEPLKGTGNGVSCKQRFSMKSYLLRCRIKF